MNVSPRRLAIIAILTIILLLTNCGVATQGVAASGETGVALRVENQSWCRVTVYRLYNGGHSSVRLGEVESMADRVFRLEVDDGLLHVGIRPFACGYGPIVSNPLGVAAGDRVQLTIPPYIPGSHAYPVA